MSDTGMDEPTSPVSSTRTSSGGQSSIASDFFAAFTEAGQNNAWPSIPRNLPRSSAHGILDNTSLDPATFEPERSNQLSLRQRHHLQRLQREAAAREEQNRQHEETDERFLRERSAERAMNVAEDRLSAHNRNLAAVDDRWKTTMQHFATTDPQRFEAFTRHGLDRLIVGVSGVQYFALLRWYTHVPKAVRNSVAEISRHYNFECKLRCELALAVDGNTNHLPKVVTETAKNVYWHADGRLKESHIYGMERCHELHAVTVGMFDPPAFINIDHETTWIDSAWNFRKVRLEQDPLHALRFPKQAGFRHSLDGSVLAFIQEAQSTYFDQNDDVKRDDLTHELINVFVEIENYRARIIFRRSEIKRLQQLIQQRRQPVFDLMARETNPATPDEERESIDERTAAASEAADHDNRPLRALLEHTEEDTMSANPYGA